MLPEFCFSTACKYFCRLLLFRPCTSVKLSRGQRSFSSSPCRHLKQSWQREDDLLTMGEVNLKVTRAVDQVLQGCEDVFHSGLRTVSKSWTHPNVLQYLIYMIRSFNIYGINTKEFFFLLFVSLLFPLFWPPTYVFFSWHVIYYASKIIYLSIYMYLYIFTYIYVKHFSILYVFLRHHQLFVCLLCVLFISNKKKVLTPPPFTNVRGAKEEPDRQQTEG